MINALLTGVINLITGLVSTILKPIDLIISTALPSLDNAINSIGQLLNFISQGLGWAISLTGLSSECIALIVVYYTFKLTVPLMVSTVKSAIKWYNALKL